jgi:hypothetical protein
MELTHDFDGGDIIFILPLACAYEERNRNGPIHVIPQTKQVC